jgi:hypothetical protein
MSSGKRAQENEFGEYVRGFSLRTRTPEKQSSPPLRLHSVENPYFSRKQRARNVAPGFSWSLMGLEPKSKNLQRFLSHLHY